MYSPIPRAAVVAAVRETASGNTDPRARLGYLLHREYAADRAILCASGTVALQLAIRAAIDQAGAAKPVALPAFSCYDVATAAVGAEARIAVYDIDPHTLGPDLDSLDDVLRAGAGVVVVAHLFGVPLDWDSLEGLVAAHDAILIEDAAQGHGARWNGRRLGALGRISVLSFGRGKGWTGGGGGALLIRGGSGALTPFAPADARGSRAPITLLRVAAQSALSRPAVYGIPASIPWLGLGETRYRAPTTPQTMGGFTAALLLHSRAASEREAEYRRRNGRALAAVVAELSNVTPIRTTGAHATPGLLRLPLRVARGFSALPTHQRLARLGATPGYPKPLAALPAVFSRLVARERRFPGAETLVRELVTLATHSLLTDRDRQQVLRLLNSKAAAR